jgi:hypothetical protein
MKPCSRCSDASATRYMYKEAMLRARLKKRQIGDHALPQRGFDLGTPEVAEGMRATLGNTGRGWQREGAQATVHQTSSKHGFTSRHCRISNTQPNQKDITGKKRAHSKRIRAGTSGQEAEWIQEPGHAKVADICRVKRVNMQRLAHVCSRHSVTRHEIQEIKPQISRIWALKRGSLATEEEMMNAAPAAFNKGSPPSTTRRWPSDANLAVERAQSPCNGRESQGTE